MTKRQAPPPPRQVRVTICFNSMEDAADFVRECKDKHMLGPGLGLRREEAHDRGTHGLILDRLVVTRVPATVGWVLDPNEQKAAA